MPIIGKMKKMPKIEDTKKTDDKKKYKKGRDSDSDGENKRNESDNSQSGSDGDHDGGENFDMNEYRKMLAELFPSKYINNRVSAFDNHKTARGGHAACDDNESNAVNIKSNNKQENKKVTRSSAKKASEENRVVESKKSTNKVKNTKYNEKGKKKGSNNPPPSDDESDKDRSSDTSSTSTNCSDDDAYDSQDDAGFGEFAKDQLKNGKFNIVINLLNDKKGGRGEDSDDESGDQWLTDEDDDDDDDSEYDDDDDDTDSDPDYNPDEDEDAEEEEEEEEEHDDDRGAKKGMSKNKYDRHGRRYSKYSKKKNDSRSSNSSNNTENSANASTESLETIQTIKSQMEEILKVNKNDSIARQMFNSMIKKEKEYKDREEKRLRNQQRRHVKQFKKMLRKKNSTNDLKYFKDHLSTDEQTAVLKELEHLNKLTITDKPYRLALLQSNIPQVFKAIALKKITNLRYMEPGAGEYYKIKNWVDTFMQIPFGRHCNLPLTITDGIEKCHDFMENAKSTLDSAVYGLNDAKMQIMQMLGQWIANPSAMGTAIAINGPMGTGKTSLVKEGISKILNREFAFVPLGGATDSSYLEGHSYTYEGSTWGKIVDILIRSKSMNPVIYFDELDKISETPKGEEIIGILTHLTDTSQNSQFHDKYFAEIDFDLSKCLFIFSYNDPMKVNPILLDRMYKIKTMGYPIKDKIVIAKQYLIPRIRYEVNFKEGDIIIPDATLNYIIENYTEKEDGVRNLKRCIEIVYKKLNLYRLVKPGTTLFDKENTLSVEFPFTVTCDIINNLIKKDDTGLGKASINMYL
jgi:ATP-dependent Lon protease